MFIDYWFDGNDCLKHKSDNEKYYTFGVPCDESTVAYAAQPAKPILEHRPAIALVNLGRAYHSLRFKDVSKICNK